MKDGAGTAAGLSIVLSLGMLVYTGVYLKSCLDEYNEFFDTSMGEIEEIQNVTKDAWNDVIRIRGSEKPINTFQKVAGVRYRRDLPGQCSCMTKSSCPPGPPGPKGFNGLDGVPGQPGPRGADGIPAQNLELHMDLTANGCIKCPAGAPGTPGQPGRAGAPGPPGKVGDNGEEGADGPPGPAGAPGDAGRPGVAGARGPPGPPGNDGNHAATGRPGPKGPPGPPGPAGPPGNVGVAEEGPDGLPGQAGDAGLPGMPGARGRAGYPGMPGVPGSDAAYCSCPHRSQVIQPKEQTYDMDTTTTTEAPINYERI